MSRVAFDFRSACRDLSDGEHAAIADQLDRCCPSGQARGYENYAYRVYWLARAIRATKIVELGVANGTSTLPLLLALQRTNGRLWSCDLQSIHAACEHFANYPVDRSRWECVESMRADDYGRSWSGGLVDMVYLDTSHTYEDTKLEIAAWWPHVREGGLFVFHDVESGRGSVFRAIADNMVQTWVATTAFQDRSIEYHHFPDCYGHGVLQWFEGSRFHIPPHTNDSLVSLSTLLAEASR